MIKMWEMHDITASFMSKRNYYVFYSEMPIIMKKHLCNISVCKRSCSKQKRKYLVSCSLCKVKLLTAT